MRHKTSGYFLLSALLVSLILGLCILLNLRCPQAVSDDALTQEQLAEVLGHHENSLGFSPQDGAALIQYTFSQWYYVVIYLVWFFALWFHLTHGVWSMFQTVGWANDTWYPRLKCIANIVATIIFLGFAAVVVVYFIKSICPCCAGAC